MPRIFSVMPTVVDRLDPVDAWRLEDPPLPFRVVGHAWPTRLTTSIALSTSVPNGDDDVLVDPGPGSRPVRSDLDLAVRDGVDDPSRSRSVVAAGEVLDRPGHAGDRDHVAPAELVLDEDQAPFR